MSRAQARQVGDLNEQLRIATSGLPIPESAPRIWVRHGEGVQLDRCELWGLIGQQPVLARICELPAGIGLRMSLVAQAAQNAGFTIPTTDQRRRAAWRRIQLPATVTTPWFELTLTLEPPRDAGA
ncbi:hypothetical protein [Myceligenerans crystallogenes]